MATTIAAATATAAATTTSTVAARALLQADVTLDDEGGWGGGAVGGVSVGAVFVLTLLMAAASGLGALPFFFVGRLSPKLAGIANALACGRVVYSLVVHIRSTLKRGALDREIDAHTRARARAQVVHAIRNSV